MALSRAERCLALLLRLLSRACLALLALLPPPRAGPARAAPRAVPPPRHALLLLPARRLAELLRARQVACVEVVEAYVERIKEVNPLINAVVKDRFEEALQEARQVDKLLAEGPGDDCLEEKFPLLGVPITVKEAFSLYGMPNTSGLVNRRNVIATSDATVVSRLKQAGAIPLGVTNCSELCMWYESSNRVYGRTNNPYDLQRIVGGSSGGEGSVLAAAGSVVGVGSDIGGSIRMPAFFNGVFGHKPTTGVVPNDGQFPNAQGVRTSYLCTGPMCRYAEDLEPVLRVMAGPGVSKLKLNEKVSLEKIKFHCMDHDGGSIFVSPVDKEILQAQKKVVEHLESDLGVRVQHVAIHKMKYSFQIWSAMMSSKDSEGQVCQSELAEAQLWRQQGRNSCLGPAVESCRLPKPTQGLSLLHKLVNLNLSGKAKLVSMGKSLQEEMEALLGPDGVLLYPSHPTIAPKHHSPICMPFNFAYTAIFNVLGLPVTQCPLGLGREGLPLGIQLVAASYNDHLTLAVARYLEKAFGGWVLPGEV
uniref:Fatty acid amide hydrolase 2 n=1 Tax=Junco hyemalis TaxID=40217 RepID=A0A8C5JH87_JUNHY